MAQLIARRLSPNMLSVRVPHKLNILAFPPVTGLLEALVCPAVSVRLGI